MKGKIFLTLLILLLTLSSCSLEHGDEPGGDWSESYPLSIYAGILGKKASGTRAEDAPLAARGTEDEWSFTGFTNGNVMGFYSAAGNYLVDEGNGAFTNLKLQYDAAQKQFNDLTNGVEFSPTKMSDTKIYMYYPYCDVMTDPDAVESVPPATPDDEDDEDDDDQTPSFNPEYPGLELRVKPEDNDTLRCIDFLSSYKIQVDGVKDGKRVALFGDFDHAFAELIIMRGEGFDNPPKGSERITAVLQDPITHIRVDATGSGTSWNLNPVLYYNPASNLNTEEAQRWDCWHGQNFSKTVDDIVGQPAWYVIVPTIGNDYNPIGNTDKLRPGPRSLVQYIEICDNEGVWHQVTSLRLSGGLTKYVDATWRYPMEISMKEMVPTVNPFDIVDWNDDVNLTDQRTRGINNITEFAQWVQAYNLYLLDPENQTWSDALLNYGDLYVDENLQKSWHFYLLADIDMNEYSPLPAEDGTMIPEGNTILLTLQDILDGESTNIINGKFVNHKIKNLSKTFVDNLKTTNAKIINIDFIEPDIRINTSSPIGIISNRMEDSTIDNCAIDNGNLINEDGPAGFVSGSMSGGSVTNCVLSGFLICTQTGTGASEKIIGTTPEGDYILKDNDVSDLVVRDKNED